MTTMVRVSAKSYGERSTPRLVGRVAALGILTSAVTMSLGAVSATLAGPADAAPVSLPPAQGIVGTPLTPISTVDTTGMAPPVTLTISPMLPAGLSFDAGTSATAGTGVISGTPTAAIAATTFSISATDSTPGTPLSAAVDVSISVAGLLSGPARVTGTVGQPLPGKGQLTVQGLSGSVTYMAPSAPSWLAISGAGALSGTPDIALPATAIVVTAADSSGATAQGSFTLAAVPALVPSTQSILAQVGTALPSPTTTLGTPSASSYIITPPIDVATGLTFNPLTGAVSGTPTIPIASTDFTVQETLSADNSVIGQGIINVTVDGLLSATPQQVTGTVGSAITPLNAYGPAAAAAAGLVAPFTYSTSPALPGVAAPGDLVINASNGVISGRPTAAAHAAKYTVMVTDSKGVKASGPIVVTISGQLVPVSQTLIATVAASTNSRTLTPSGMVPPVTYAISSTLPPGMQFNVSTGMVSGIPRATLAATAFEITATDANGAKATAKVTLTVGRALMGAPIIGSISGGPKAGSLQIIFTRPSLAPVGQSYVVLVYDSYGDNLVTSVETTVSPVMVEGLTPGETYQVVVAANATDSYDRVESLPKSGVASTGTTATVAQATSAPAAALVSTPATISTALSRAGITLAPRTEWQAAMRVKAVRPPGRTLGRAPKVRVSLGTMTRIQVPRVVLPGRIVVNVRLAGVWVPLGTAHVDAKHRLRLPAFSAARSGTYPIQLKPSAGGHAMYLSVVVKP
jgi:hypothetical protein